MRMTGRRRSSNIEDRRHQKTSGMSSQRLGGAGSALPLILIKVFASKAGRRFLLPLIILGAIAYFVFPNQVKSILGGMLGGQTASQSQPVNDAADQAAADFTSVVLAGTEDIWGELYPAWKGERYRAPTLVLYRGGTQTACGFGQATFGPFYCPADERVYIDLSFLNEMKRMNADGDFAWAYVIAHEVGHHVEKLDGTLDWSAQIRARGNERESNQAQVYVELKADCLAGVWAHHDDARFNSLEPGDIEEALAAANAVGDDTLQRKASGRVVPDSFTHGTSEQRMRWFRRGFDTGDPAQCETRDVAYDRL